jgi:hypothetical protein
MASKTITTLVDDVDGSEADETVQFSIDGTTWEIDLSEPNAKRLRESLGEFIDHGRKVGGRGKRSSASFDGIDNKAVRAWAKSAGIALSARGRIPAGVIQQYRAAGK